jgi:hypothetical protein
MSLEVELYRTDDYIRYGTVQLLPLLCGFFEQMIGQPLAGARFELAFLPVDDPGVLPGTPSMVNLRASHGFIRVRVLRDRQLLYQHPHPVREVVGPQLQHLLSAREPAETHWGYGIRGQELDRIGLVRPAPQVRHARQVDPRAGRPPLFHLEDLDGPQPPEAGLGQLGVAAPADRPATGGGAVDVVLPDSLHEQLVRAAPFSAEVEEGGFLAGHLYRDPERPGRHIAEVTAAIPAERTGASMLNFTYTGESFLRVSESITSRGNGERLLGWYHTHLFPATESLGLSSVDIELHRSTFRQPWQVAALVNVDADRRVLRFYTVGKDTVAQAPYWQVAR